MGATARVRIGEKGRLVIPAVIRKELGIKPGDQVEMRVEDDELRMSTRRARIRQAQERVRQCIPQGVSLAEELSAERREAARRE